MKATTPIRTTSEGILRLFFSEPPASGNSPAILLDRDGVINERVNGGYVTQWSEFRFIGGMTGPLAELSRLGLPMLVVSNQAGVGKGLVSHEALAEITERFVARLREQGARIDAVYYCPHTAEAHCPCRKPAVGLLKQAAQDWHVDLERAVLVGDSASDMEAAQACRCRALLVAPECAGDAGPQSTMPFRYGEVHAHPASGIARQVRQLLGDELQARAAAGGGAHKIQDLVLNPGCNSPVSADAIKTRILQEITSQCTNFFGKNLQSIVLTGSMSRGEATLVEDPAGWTMLGDVESVLVVDGQVPLPAHAEVIQLRRLIEAKLREERILVHVGLTAWHPRHLRKMSPNIFAHELRTCGKVLWGQEEILSLIPSFEASEIPLEDAWRMLCHRMIEVLEFAEALPSARVFSNHPLHYRIVKLYLDMATSLLLFSGAYVPSYQGRADRLESLALTANEGRFPFSLGQFSARVKSCTRFKLFGPIEGHLHRDETCDDSDAVVPLEAMQYASLLWRWELAQMVGEKNALSDRALLAAWLREQPAMRRVRGWLYAMRARRWLRSYRYWPHWLRLALQASPRYWIYATCSEFYRRFIQLFGSDVEKDLEGQRNWEELQGCLPVTERRLRAVDIPAWRLIAADIVDNYREFLLETRA